MSCIQFWNILLLHLKFFVHDIWWFIMQICNMLLETTTSNKLAYNLSNNNCILQICFSLLFLLLNFLYNSDLHVFHHLIPHFYNSNVDGLFVTFFCFRWFTAIVEIGRAELVRIHVFLLCVLVHASFFQGKHVHPWVFCFCGLLLLLWSWVCFLLL